MISIRAEKTSDGKIDLSVTASGSLSDCMGELAAAAADVMSAIACELGEDADAAEAYAVTLGSMIKQYTREAYAERQKELAEAHRNGGESDGIRKNH